MKGFNSFRVKQISKKDNLLFYGIGTDKIRSLAEPRLDVEFVGLRSFNGNCYFDGKQHKIGKKGIEAGEIVEVKVNTMAWTIDWYCNSIKCAEISIPVQMRNKAIYPVILMNHFTSDQVELL